MIGVIRGKDGNLVGIIGSGDSEVTIVVGV